jgi:hypothetical protein
MSAVAVVVATMAAAPGVAGAQDACPEANPTYTSNCGPTFVVPAWGDAGGWTDPSTYSTIQLTDFNSDGRDELMARNDQGIEIYWFDTSLGQWRPQVDANGVQQLITDFRSPLPSEDPATDWTPPEYYSTIQTAHINGNKSAQILARFADGMRVYYFNPGPGGSINGGSWSTLSSQGPFSDADGWDNQSMYSTIRTINMDEGNPAITELVGRSHDGLVGYSWNGGGWSPLPLSDPAYADSVFEDGTCLLPSCTHEFRAQQIGNCWAPPTGCNASAPPQAMIGRRADGLNSVRYTFDIGSGGGSWDMDSASPLITGPDTGRFGDIVGGPDCPFIPNTDLNDCLSTSPSYYETLGVADFDSDGVDEVYARAADGLRVLRRNIKLQADFLVDTDPAWTQLATLTDLGGAAFLPAYGSVGGLWGSIRTANIDGTGGDEVLALDGKGLGAWSYNAAANAWTKLQPSTPLTLAVDPWVRHPEYYWTIQTGDVDGDGRADVIARGPYGIRTWFYNRRGTGGWERYLPDGYPAFPTAGQQAAFDALNVLALSKGAFTTGKIRDVWTQPTPPDTTTLQTNLASVTVGNCTNETRFAPPTYASCVPPAGITAADWTPVVNEVLSEAYDAEQVIDHFGDVDTMRKGVFASESGSLPAIASDLQLNGAAGSTTTFDFQSFFAGTAGIAASIAGVAPEGGAEVSAAMWVASELVSMLPSASTTANSTFQGTYDTLIAKLATAQDEMAVALASQRQQVLGDQGLLGLVGRLRSTGVWKPDTDGMQSASREAFALQIYQALLPTMYNRYVVTNCTDVFYPSGDETDCTLPSGKFVTGGGTNRTWLGPPAADPCFSTNTVTDCEYQQNPGTMPYGIANVVWGAVSPTCNYKPPNKNTLWTYGCSLGVPYAQGILADGGGWSFTTESGDPEVVLEAGATRAVRATPGTVRATGARTGSSAAAAQAGASPLAAREVLAPLRFTGRVSLSRGVRLRRMRVVVDRMLFEHGRREELARSASGHRLRPFALSHVWAGLFTFRRRGAPRVRLRLRPLDVRGRARLDLTLSRVRTRDVRALCTVLLASVHLAGRPLELETRLRVRDSGVSGRVTLRQRWRCVRDRKGEFTGIRPIKPRRPAARPGLAVRLGAPRVSASGRRATVPVTVANQRRRRPSRMASSLWDLRITGGAGSTPRTIGFKELRAGRSRTVRLTVPVPRRARRCARVAGTPRAGCSAAANAACMRAAKPQRAAHATPRRVPRDRSRAQE